MENKIKLLEDKLNLVTLVLGKVINGIPLNHNEKDDMRSICEQAEREYIRMEELRKAFNKHMSLELELHNLECEFPELKSKKENG